MVNKVTLIGNLGRDPEVRKLDSGSTVAKFSVATNESYRDKSGEWQTITEWHNVVAWRGLAERVERDFKKGTMVYVEGKLTTRKWQDKEGNDRYTTEVQALMCRSLERREGAGRTGGADFPSEADEMKSMASPMADPSTTATPDAPKAAEKSYDSIEDDDDLPF